MLLTPRCKQTQKNVANGRDLSSAFRIQKDQLLAKMQTLGKSTPKVFKRLQTLHFDEDKIKGSFEDILLNQELASVVKHVKIANRREGFTG